MAIDPAILQAIWYRALEAEVGIAMCPNNPKDIPMILNQCYEARKVLGDPELDKVMICRPGTGDEIFFIHKSVELDDANSR